MRSNIPTVRDNVDATIDKVLNVQGSTRTCELGSVVLFLLGAWVIEPTSFKRGLLAGRLPGLPLVFVELGNVRVAYRSPMPMPPTEA
jgi:hypothetical protein